MSVIRMTRLALAVALALAVSALPALAQGTALRLESARVTLNGTSNVHAWTAVSTDVRLVAARVAAASEGDVLDAALKPGGLEAFAIAIPVMSLTSPKGDIDQNMHKALLAEQHPEIAFALIRLEGAADGSYRAVGTMRIVGAEREVPLMMTVERTGASAKVRGEVTLDMTQFGVTPPKALMGMLKTGPKVTVRFEAVLAQ